MKKKINVLHVFRRSLPKSRGGIETVIDTLSKASNKIGVNNVILCLDPNPSLQKNHLQGYEVVEAKENFSIASIGFSFSAFKIFKELAKKTDIIHYHFPNPFSDLLQFFFRPKKPIIITYHSDIIRQKTLLKFYRIFMYLFLKSADRIVATSPNYLNTSKVLNRYIHKTVVIPIGIESSNYKKPKKDKLDYWKKQLPQPFYLFVGVLRYYKGLYIALDSFRNTKHHLVLAGYGGIENELKKYAKNNKMHNTYFLGYVSEEDKVALLSLCRGFIFPSNRRSEAFGIALLEAAMHKKPLISCEIGTGTSYINVNEKTGYVIKPSSKSSLKRAIENLDNNDLLRTHTKDILMNLLLKNRLSNI